jgi:hypothetical protein
VPIGRNRVSSIEIQYRISNVHQRCAYRQKSSSEIRQVLCLRQKSTKGVPIGRNPPWAFPRKKSAMGVPSAEIGYPPKACLSAEIRHGRSFGRITNTRCFSEKQFPSIFKGGVADARRPGWVGFRVHFEASIKCYSNASLHGLIAPILSESCLRSKGAAAGRV